MIRFLINLVVYFVAAFIGIVVADIVLTGFTVDGWTTYVVVAVIFAIVQAILAPLIGSMVEKNAAAFSGGVGIISTLVALIITNVVVKNLTIDGVSNWILGALIVWLAAAIAAFVLPFFIVKRAVKERRS